MNKKDFILNWLLSLNLKNKKEIIKQIDLAKDMFDLVDGIISNNPANTLPFGKHAGKDLKNIPSEYLNWCLTDFNKLNKAHEGLIKGELKRRNGGEDDTEFASDDIPF